MGSGTNGNVKMSIIAEIKKDSSGRLDGEYPVFIGGLNEVEDDFSNICSGCQYREYNRNKDTTYCPAGVEGGGDFKYDSDLEIVVCVEATNFNMFGPH